MAVVAVVKFQRPPEKHSKINGLEHIGGCSGRYFNFLISTTTYKTAFDKYMHGQPSNDDIAVLDKYMNESGIPVPKGYAGDFESSLKAENLFRRYASLVKAEDDGRIRFVLSDGIAEIVEENTAYPNVDDTIKDIWFSSYKLASLAKLSSDLIDTKEFDFTAYIVNIFSKRFGKGEERVFLYGSGSNEPLGLLTGAGAVTAERASVGYEDMMRLYLALDRDYRKNAVWIMNDTTALKLRMVKDTSGGYIWNSYDNTLLGRPIVISPNMPDISEGEKPIVFADLSYYLIIERQPLSVKKLMELFIRKGLIGITASERIYGTLLRPESAKVLLT